MDKKELLKFIKKQKLAVISTVSPDSIPEAAVLEFGETDELELIFDTFIKSRKYENLKVNPKAAFVIGWDENITAQYLGEAVELEGEELQRCKDYYFKKNPRAKEWDGREGIAYFKVMPKWIKYSDLNKHPWEIHEFTF